MRFVVMSFAACLLAGAAAQAGTDLNLPKFSAIEAHGGSHIILHHGATQRVTVIKGDMKVSSVTVVGDKLLVEECPTWCLHHPELEIEVTTPNPVEALAAHGGGDIDARGPFPRQPKLSVTAHGGGNINASAIPADTVWAEAHGGGEIRVNALTEINAEAHGGGDIHYTGNPPKVHSSVHGGGDVSRD